MAEVKAPNFGDNHQSIRGLDDFALIMSFLGGGADKFGVKLEPPQWTILDKWAQKHSQFTKKEDTYQMRELKGCDSVAIRADPIPRGPRLAIFDRTTVHNDL